MFFLITISLLYVHSFRVNIPTTTTIQSKQYNRKISLHRRFMDSSSSVSPSPAPKQSPKAFIISPSTGKDELLILQNFNQIQAGDRKRIGIIGSQDLSENHIQMVELLAYALVLSGNHVYTSGGQRGTNVAVIRGALRACNPDLLTVILPQSLLMQPAEMQSLLLRVANLEELPNNDGLDLKTAASLCNEKLLSIVDKILVFAYHSSDTILGSLETTSAQVEKILFYLD